MKMAADEPKTLTTHPGIVGERMTNKMMTGTLSIHSLFFLQNGGQ
jgi:hypothetical protein